MTGLSSLDVHVDTVPHPGLIRSRIESALAGRATDPGPEQAIGLAVADAVAAITARIAAAVGPGARPAAQEGARD